MRYKDSTQELINKCIFSFIKRRHNQVQYLKRSGYTHKDILQELQLGAHKARLEHDPDKGTLTTLLKHALSNTMSKVIERVNKSKSFNSSRMQQLTLDEYYNDAELFDDYYSPKNYINQIIFQKDFNFALRHLEEEEVTFLKCYAEHSMEKTARILKKHRSTLYDIKGRIKNKLNNAGFENYFH